MTEQTATAADIIVEAATTETISDDIVQAEESTEAVGETNRIAQSETDAAYTTEEAPVKENAVDGTVFTPVYNGAVIPVRATDTERVTTLLQKGMKFEHMAEDLEKLHQLTSAYGAKNAGELLDRMISERDRSQKEEYIRKYGEEAGEKLFALEKEQRCAKNGSFAQTQESADQLSREAVNQRLASEYLQLRAVYPTLSAFRDVPQDVIRTALEEEVSLLDAYHRHTLHEQQRVASAAQIQADNRRAATGTLAGDGSQASDPVWEAFLRGAGRAVGKQ